MRVVRPQATPSGSRTLTAALSALRPSPADLIDAGFVFSLGALALFGFATTFDGWRYLAVGAVGLLVGIALAHLAGFFRWHWLTVPVLATLAYFSLGPALAVPADAVIGFLPSITALRRLMGLAIGGWKELLTTLPPLDAASEYLALPLLLALVVGSVGLLVARRTRAAWPALVAPGALLGGVLALGTLTPAGVLVQGLGFALLSVAWLMIRARRRKRLIGTGRTNGVQIALGAGVLAAALAAGALLGPVLPGMGQTRQVLRSYVQPPIESTSFPSPLEGFRTFSSKQLNLAYEQPLLKVDGLPAGARLRLAVLTDYTGAAWSAAGAGDGASGFQRLGSHVPNAPQAGLVTAKVEVQPALAANNDLNVWIPSLGRTASVAFEGANVRAHQASFRFNIGTDQGYLPDRLKAGDVVSVASAPLESVDPGSVETLDPGSGALLADQSSSFLNATAQKLGGSSNIPLERLRAIADELKDGAWSDGTKPGEEYYLPGHGIYRLTRMVQGQQLVGSDEHYASLFAILANLTGYPSRVVFGAVVPENGVVAGKDIHVWVELQVNSGTWVAVPDQYFTPDRQKSPQQTTTKQDEQKAATKVPPPNPVRPPASTDELAESQPSGARITPTEENPWAQNLLAILMVVGPPTGLLALIVSLILGAKAWRRRRRRTRGALSTRIAGGWQEVLDQARDLGRTIPTNQTRLEQSRTLGGGELTALAAQADRSVFGAGEITDQQVTAFWSEVGHVRKAMLKADGWWRGLRGRLSLRSLLRRGEIKQAAKTATQRPRRRALGA